MTGRPSPRHADPSEVQRPSAPGSRRDLRAFDVLAIVVPAALFVLLAAIIRLDPTPGFTSSRGPFTDEAWDVINARNLILLGRWSTDDWNLHLVNVPYSVAMAAVFQVLGVGLVQARLVSIVASTVTTLALAVGLRRTLGPGPALLAAVAFGASSMVLYYGRLAFLEPSVTMWLTLGTLTSLRARTAASPRWGAFGGLAFALAIGTKPSALFAVVGIVTAVAVVGRRSREVRRWAAGATGVVASGALLWIALIGVPDSSAVLADLRIWASEPILTAPMRSLRNAVTFPFSNDGFVVHAAPLLVFGGCGLGLAVLGRAALPRQVRDLTAGAAGWLAAGLGLLAVAPYRPNRYEVPVLPALAILGAIGAWVTVSGGVRPRGPARLLISRRPIVVGLVIAAGLVAPGAWSYGTWVRSATTRQPAIQAIVAATVPPGEVMQGDLAPGVALGIPVTTIVSRPPTLINPGDLYATRGVRWYVGSPTSSPIWAALHPEAWAARSTLLCGAWGPDHICVWHVP